MDESINRDKTQFRVEVVLALVATGLACAAGMSNLLFAPNDLYPLTSDAMGHMAKVRYLAESFSSGVFPSWFPYWYNGSTVSQYYPPLSYWIMVPMYLLIKNAMITFKLDCFLMIFVGGMGVWYFCRLFIGRWCGIIGSVFFCLQPYILLTFYAAGLLAQGPVIALTPWYMIAIVIFLKKKNAKSFLVCTLLCALMILSHPMTIFMICLCFLFVFLIFVVLKKITITLYFYLVFSMGFAGLLTAFWSVAGVTGLETPGIPYLLVEASLNYTATLKWYTTQYSNFFYFAIPISICIVLAIMTFTYRRTKQQTDENEQYYVLFCIIITLFTILFSFGLNLPLFRYLPLAESYVPGRILGLTSVTGAVLSAYLIYTILCAARKSRKTSWQTLATVVSFLIIGAVLFFMNPYKINYFTLSNEIFYNMFAFNNNEGSAFEKGRYACIGVFESSETYFPISFDSNMTIGWNIEGTPHNRSIWNHNIAIPTGNFDYVAKDFAFWNVRALYAEKKYEQTIIDSSPALSFSVKSNRGDNIFLTSNAPSSYFLKDERNAIIIGIGSPGVAIEFPYLVKGYSDNLSDYTVEELKKFDLIYLCEPYVNNQQEKMIAEKLVEALIDNGKMVLIEPTNTNGHSLFGVTTLDVINEYNPQMQKQINTPIHTSLGAIDVGEGMPYSRVLFGLDEVYYKLVQNSGSLENDVIGAKKTGRGEVLFIGMHLSKFLKAVHVRNWGLQEGDDMYPECSDDVKALFEDIFSTYGVNKDFWPDPFPVEKADWNYKGVDFEYSSPMSREMTLSVTYTPRWKAALDGKPIPVGQKENLVTLDLPAGDHEVSLTYGITKYGIAGYIISFLGLLFFVLFLKFYDIIIYHFRHICTRIGNFFQFRSGDQQID